MRKYELAVVLHPDLEIDMKPALAKIEGFITSGGGKILNQDNWGKQKLAYPVDKQNYGIYVIYRFEVETAHASELEKNLVLDEEVMRHLLVKVDERAEAAVAQSLAERDNKNTKEKLASQDSKVKAEA